MMIAFDIVQRWLRASGYPLTYVRNITDIDDKIIRRAAETGEPVPLSPNASFATWTKMQRGLRCRSPTSSRAQQSRCRDVGDGPKIGGARYRLSGGKRRCEFLSPEVPGYGKLSGKSLEDLRAGERVEVDTTKRDPLDFVLWKRAKEGEPFWHSPWGTGVRAGTSSARR